MPAGDTHDWWERGSTWLLLGLVFALPFAFAPIPPLTDLPGHVGRYAVMLDGGQSATLSQWYRYSMAPVGNLGVDLVVLALAPHVGLLATVKWTVLAIPPLTVTGFWAVARQVHGRLHPFTLLAIPFVTGHHFIFGFVNFALGIALAFWVFWLWIRLDGRGWLRALLIVPLSLIVYFSHVYAWGVLGLMVGSHQLMRHRAQGAGWIAAAWKAGMDCLPLCLPLAQLVFWRAGASAEIAYWADLKTKGMFLVAPLRDRWLLADVYLFTVPLLALYLAARRKGVRFDGELALPAGIMFLVFLLLPRIVFGSNYADMRIYQFALALGLLAIVAAGKRDERREALFAWGILGLLAVRVGLLAASGAIATRDQRDAIALIEPLPQGTRLLQLTLPDCGNIWALPRSGHLGAFNVALNDGFSNDQWKMGGANGLEISHLPAGEWQNDPSQVTKHAPCGRKDTRPFEWSMANFPRAAFDNVLVVGEMPVEPSPDLRPVAGRGSMTLFEVDR
ncbi:hypothetical protein [Sphingomicrobium nitratireducens]|uniref:hypothetical protein n=1 Tax=Sphingomicrobium nitratireducens TaxID=2964666 RepID=UPI0022409DF5|nr:hypothetical protein [Sphingomicrobium nitratireducens]